MKLIWDLYGNKIVEVRYFWAGPISCRYADWSLVGRRDRAQSRFCSHAHMYKQNNFCDGFQLAVSPMVFMSTCFLVHYESGGDLSSIWIEGKFAWEKI